MKDTNENKTKMQLNYEVRVVVLKAVLNVKVNGGSSVILVVVQLF